MKRVVLVVSLVSLAVFLGGCVPPEQLEQPGGEEDIITSYSATAREVTVQVPSLYLAENGVLVVVRTLEVYTIASGAPTSQGSCEGTELRFTAPEETTWRLFVTMRDATVLDRVAQVAYDVTVNGDQLVRVLLSDSGVG